MKNPNPVWVWLPTDHRILDSGNAASPYLVLGDKYARALRECTTTTPVLFPLAQVHEIDTLLSCVDGVMLTGSPSNVGAEHYGQSVLDPKLPLDPTRDTLTLALIRTCLDRGVPLLGLCRGFQEMNVALGGTLHQAVHRVSGYQDHRENDDDSLAEQYAPAHEVKLVADSVMAEWAGAERSRVNSLHGQGIDQLAPALEPLAWAPDGLIEAVGVKNAKAFAYGVQWHPEWQSQNHPFYSALFQAFGQACEAHQQQRLANAAQQ